MTKPYLRWLVLALATVAVVWLSLRETEPDRVAGSLRALATALRVEPGEGEAARRQRVEAALNAKLAPGARIQVPDLPAGDLVGVAMTIGARFEEASIQIEQPNVALDSEGRTAQVHARLLLSGKSSESGLVTDVRDLRAHLRQQGTEWQLTQLETSAASHVEPEARP
jgi:hypothetical protein